MEHKILSINDLTKITGISRTTVYREVRKGILPCVRIGRRVLFLQKDVDAYLEKNRIPAKETPQPLLAMG